MGAIGFLAPGVVAPTDPPTPVCVEVAVRDRDFPVNSHGIRRDVASLHIDFEKSLCKPLRTLLR